MKEVKLCDLGLGDDDDDDNNNNTIKVNRICLSHNDIPCQALCEDDDESFS